jgi:hypothetical protein
MHVWLTQHIALVLQIAYSEKMCACVFWGSCVCMTSTSEQLVGAADSMQ